MIILQINSCNYGSTGNIMLGLSKTAERDGHTVYTAVPKSRSNLARHTEKNIFIGSRLLRNLHIRMAELTGFNGCGSVIDTLIFLRKVSRIKPDLIHLHNLHNCYINLPLLFGYIKKHGIRVVWTLHDCWAFTGKCPYFTMAKCDRWRTGCYGCPYVSEYPKSLNDRTKRMYELKKKWFTGVKNLTIVTPSEWLAGLVRESFLREYDIKVINNGIDLEIFRPIESDFRKKNKLDDKYIVLGVAAPWTKRKGLDTFLKLAERLDDRYVIVLVGVSDEQIRALPRGIIGIKRTENQHELAEIYTAADVFANPTREEVFGLVNAEALACGTPVVTYRTGGCPEIVDRTCGSIVDCDDIDAFEAEIRRVCEEKIYASHKCIQRAAQYDIKDRFRECTDLY